MSAPIEVQLTLAQIVQIVRAIDKAGPVHSTGPSAVEQATATQHARALLAARNRLVSAYMSRPMRETQADSLPMTLPFAPPWRLERFFKERVGLFEPVNAEVEIPHEGIVT